MPRVTVKDVNQQEVVRALAAFLKKSGKLRVPEWEGSVKLAKRKELALHLGCLHGLSPVPPRQCQRGLLRQHLRWACQRNGVVSSHFSQGSKSMAWRVLQALEGLRMGEKDQDEDQKPTPQGQKDLDRIDGQVAAAKKKH